MSTWSPTSNPPRSHRDLGPPVDLDLGSGILEPVRAVCPWLVLAPIPATLVGAATAHAHGVSLVAFLPNLASLLVGGAGFLWWTRPARGAGPPPTWLSVALVVAVAATLVAPGLEGVHRWLPLGPLRINASAALAPWLLLGLADGEGGRWRGAAVAVLGVGAVHLAQPDAAQATALACGAMPPLLGVAGRHRRATVAAAGLLVVLVALAGAAWSRPDPLPALPHVEQVLVLALRRGPLWAAVAALAVTTLFAPALAAWRGGGRGRLVGAGAALYLAGQLAATFVGNYPVAVLGAGAGPVLGWWAMAAICSGCGAKAARGPAR